MISDEELYSTINRPNDLSWPQWKTIYDFTITFRPRLIVEFGRGYGNSTCLFTEASNHIGCKIVSIGNDSERDFESTTWPHIAPLVGSNWRKNLTVIQSDIMETNFSQILGTQRTLLFWDAHGRELADFIIEYVFPLLMQAEHQVLMHDVGQITDPKVAKYVALYT